MRIPSMDSGCSAIRAPATCSATGRTACRYRTTGKLLDDAEEVGLGVHRRRRRHDDRRLAGDRLGQPRQQRRRLQGQVRRSTCYNAEEGIDRRRDDGVRQGPHRGVQPRGHREGDQGRQVRRDQRRQGARRAQDLEARRSRDTSRLPTARTAAMPRPTASISSSTASCRRRSRSSSGTSSTTCSPARSRARMRSSAIWRWGSARSTRPSTARATATPRCSSTARS